MLEIRLYSSVPPPARTALDDHATLLVSYWCSLFSLTVILFRLAGRYIRTERLFREDKIMAASIIPLMGRLGLVHVVLLYGTNNADTAGLSDESIRRRKIGSRLVLLSRIMYAAFLWVQKFTITEFLARLTKQYWKKSYEIGLQTINYTLAVSFVAVVISTVSECHPIQHYWQVVPDPGPQCRQAFAQLITMGACNVITDILLIVFPIPIVIKSQMTVKRKIQLTLLFSLSAIPIGITLYRIPSIIDHKGVQQYRTLWASIEILAAAAVANALVLGSFVRDRGIKKIKYKFGSAGGDSIEQAPSFRRGTAATAAFWGSDEDLVRGMGMGVDPEFRAMEQVVRPAPMAQPAPSRGGPNTLLHNPDWRGHGSPTSQDTDNDSDIDLKMPEPTARSPGDAREMASRKVAFFDVGGLLDDEPKAGRNGSDSTTASKGENISPTNTNLSTAAYDFAQPRGRAAGGTGNFLHDVGGLLRSSPPRPPPQPQRERRSSRSLREGKQTKDLSRTNSNSRTSTKSQTPSHSHTRTSSQARRSPSDMRRSSDASPTRGYSKHLSIDLSVNDTRPLPALNAGNPPEREAENRERTRSRTHTHHGRREGSSGSRRRERESSAARRGREADVERETSWLSESEPEGRRLSGHHHHPHTTRRSSASRDAEGRRRESQRESADRKGTPSPGTRTHAHSHSHRHTIHDTSPPRRHGSSRGRSENHTHRHAPPPTPARESAQAPAPNMQLQRTATDISLQDVGGLLR